MRIPHWPVLLGGALIAAVVGQNAIANDAIDGYAGGVPTAAMAGSMPAGELFDDPAYESDDPNMAQYIPVQYLDPAAASPEFAGEAAYGGYEGYPPNYWPGTSPYSQHNMEGIYNDRGLWSYEANDEDTKWITGVDFLIAWGLKPGDKLIGDGGPASNQYFVPNITNIFPHQHTSNFSDFRHYGVRARYGWENPDDSGVLLSGFYLADSEVTVGPNTFFKESLGSLQSLASIPYDNGFGGALATFDLDFTKTYEQQAYGADLDIYTSPYYQRGKLKAQFLYGVKYLNVFESIHIRARDTSFAEIINTETGDIGAFADLGLPPLDTNIVSSTKTNLVGPQIGTKYELGGNKFKIGGQTKIAVMANISERRVWGSNAVTFSEIVDGHTTSTFSDTRNNTHISPVIDQAVYGEFPLFAMIPYVNRWSAVNRAMFRIGFNYIWIGETDRPMNDIKFRINTPEVQTNRTWFSLKMLSFAIDWKY